MSLKIDTETPQKREIAEVLRAVANWIENANNKRVRIVLNVEFQEAK